MITIIMRIIVMIIIKIMGMIVANLLVACVVL